MREVPVVAGIGGYVPETVVTNTELSTLYETTDEWIRTRTGIASRRWVGPAEATSDLAVAAGRAALSSMPTTLSRGGADAPVDMVVLATSTPDHPCPATAPLVAHRLGLGEVPAFDIAAVCSGFVYGLAIADGLIAAGAARRILLIGADTFSTILSPTDRTTAAVFGDGAGAVVLRAGDRDEPGALLGVDLGSDGGLAELITVAAGGSRSPNRDTTGDATADGGRWFSMKGQAVYRHAVTRMSAAARATMARVGWQPADVDRFVAHQANTRILATVGAELGIDADRVYSNLATVGNTVAASVPLALADAATDGTLRAGERVLISAFGGGATWGAAALTWPVLAATPRTAEEPLP